MLQHTAAVVFCSEVYHFAERSDTIDLMNVAIDLMNVASLSLSV